MVLIDGLNHGRNRTYLPWIDFQTTTTTSNGPNTKEDCFYNYICSMLSLGLVFQEFENAIREGDGDREERIWKKEYGSYSCEYSRQKLDEKGTGQNMLLKLFGTLHFLTHS